MGFTVFVPNRIALDKGIWKAWLNGYSIDQCSHHILSHGTVATAGQIDSYVTTQYRSFEMLEEFLMSPRTLQTQLLMPVPADTAQYLIATYYGYDNQVVKQLLGKRLTTRVRKDLDDVSRITRVPVVGCRRMFDNLKRIIKKVDDADAPAIDTVAGFFLLPRELATRYASILFMNEHKLDTAKKRLMTCSLADFEFGSLC